MRVAIIFKQGKYTICLVGFFVLFLFTNCSSTINLAIRGSEKLNSGGYPVTLRIYQLESMENFKLANFNSLWMEDQTVLKTDLIDKKEIRLRPLEMKWLKIKLNKKCQYIGVVADFANPEMDEWRALLSVKSNKKRELGLTLTSNRLYFQKINERSN